MRTDLNVQETLRSKLRLDSTSSTILRPSHNDNRASQHHWHINDFEQIQQLGRGKFGMVYLAREKNSRYVVAIKKMNKAELEKNSFGEQAKREIQIQSMLRH
jgi:aurora kinase